MTTKYFCPKCEAEVHIAPKWMVYGDSIPAGRLSTTEWYCRDCNEYWDYPVKENLDTKALEIAAELFADGRPIGYCILREDKKWTCMLEDEGNDFSPCPVCFFLYCRQKAEEKK